MLNLQNETSPHFAWFIDKSKNEYYYKIEIFLNKLYFQHQPCSLFWQKLFWIGFKCTGKLKRLVNWLDSPHAKYPLAKSTVYKPPLHIVLTYKTIMLPNFYFLFILDVIVVHSVNISAS